MHQVDHEYTTVFDSCTYSKEIIDIFFHLKKTLMLAFSQALHDYNLAWGPHCHSRIDDFDFVSRLQFCPKYL